MKLYAPKKSLKTALQYDEAVLNQQYNGLFRASFEEAYENMPALSTLFDSAKEVVLANNFTPDEYEIDIKIHMLMPNQYPCIPNWHCDNVPRTAESGTTDYKKAEEQYLAGQEAPMFLWVSGTPCTEFLSRDISFSGYPETHADVANHINSLLEKQCHYEVMPITTFVEPNCWYKMTRQTPHRGTMSEKNQWRIFCRLTHKNMLKERVQTTVVRRHSQVYLDSAKFSW